MARHLVFCIILITWFNNSSELHAQSQQSVKSGRQLFEEGAYKEAIMTFNRSIEGDSLDLQSYYFRGKTKMIFEDMHGAMKDYNTVLDINPEYADAYYERGNVKSHLQDYYGAIEDYGVAISLNPNLVEAYYHRGQARRELEAYKDAINDFTKIIELNPKGKDAYYLRGIIKIERGLLQEGCLDLSKAGELGDLKAYEVIRNVCN